VYHNPARDWRGYRFLLRWDLDAAGTTVPLSPIDKVRLFIANDVVEMQSRKVMKRAMRR